MRAFLDFEASSLADDSYPIEVGWVFEDGRSEAHLIRPAPGWVDWDEGAEELHGISREQLRSQGAPHAVVAHRILEALGEHAVYVSAPSWDGKWLSVLLRAAGLPRHAMRLKDCADAQVEAVVETLGGDDEAVARIIGLARQAAAAPRHRALADAEAESRLWRTVKRLAREAAEQLGPA